MKAMAEMSVEERQWEKVTVDEATRMRLNGESAKCMAHIRAIKKAGGVSLKESDGSDTSKDQTWTTDESGLSVCAARYCMITTALCKLDAPQDARPFSTSPSAPNSGSRLGEMLRGMSQAWNRVHRTHCHVLGVLCGGVLPLPSRWHPGSCVADVGLRFSAVLKV